MSNTIDVSAEIQAHTGAVVHTEITAQLHDESVVYAEITVPEVVENTMHAKFFLYGTGSKDILVDIQPRAIGTRTIESEIHSRAIRNKDIYTEIDAKYRGNSEVYVEIQPMGFVQIPAEIEVRPHTNMSAIYETKKPPIISKSHFPLQDAFTKKESGFQTINYGKSSTMVIGNNDEFESFVKFETKTMDSRYVITDVKLELSYLGEIIKGYNINLHTASRAWYETGVTYQNRPPKLDLVSNQYEIDQARKVITFDVKDIASEWLSGITENNGFVLSTTNKEPLYFKTNNSSDKYAPKLIVSYYDSIVPSTGRSQVRSEIFVYNKTPNDVRTEIEVASTFSFERIPTEIYVHQPDVPVESDVLTEITSSKGTVGAEITAIRSDESSVLAVVTARSEQMSRNKNAAITVSRDFALAEVTVRLQDKSEIDSDIYVTRDKILSELTVSVEEHRDIYVEITANDIHVRYIEAEITPRVIRSSDVFVEIEPNIKSDVLTEITATRDSVLTEITAIYRGKKEIATEIVPRPVGSKDAQSELTISKDKILTHITAARREDSDVFTEIYASHRSEVYAEIYVSNTSEVEVEIDVVMTSKKQAEITVSKPYVHSEIMVPFYDDVDILTEIRPRVLYANDVYCVITMGKVSKGYAFIL